MWHELREEIEIECGELRRLSGTFGSLLGRVNTDIPDDVETVALAGMLHSFYTGIENIFKRITIHIDGDLPRGEAWHIQLLDSMARKSRNRPAVISKSLRNRLELYMHFRHFFRHAYSFSLDWNKMKPLVLKCEKTVNMLQTELTAFIEIIEP